MDTRIGLISLAVGVLCAAGAQLGAPLWLWAIAAGVAAALLVYAFLAPQEDKEADGSGTGRGSDPGSNQGSGAGSEYNNSNVFNVTVEGKRKS